MPTSEVSIKVGIYAWLEGECAKKIVNCVDELVSKIGADTN